MASERAPGDWFDSYAWFTRYKDQQDKRIKAELAEEAAAEAARARELERQRVEAGDPAAMRSFSSGCVVSRRSASSGRQTQISGWPAGAGSLDPASD